jgi:hypothetical protein
VRRAFINALAGLCIGLYEMLKWSGLRKRRDPWRHTAGLNLRGECGKFTLAAFGVQAGADGAAGRIRDFLAKEPIAHVAVSPGRDFSAMRQLNVCDLVIAEHGMDGLLEKISPLLDPCFNAALELGAREPVHNSLMLAANETRYLGPAGRFRAITRSIAARHPERSAREYALRLLQASWLTVDSRTRERFEPPDQNLFRHPGVGLLFFTVRSQPEGTIDLWMQVHHVPADGVPMQEMLSRLVEELGGARTVHFPCHGTIIARSTETWEEGGGRCLASILGFYSFAVIKQLRHEMNAALSAELEEPVGMATVLLWCLSFQPEFARLKVSVVVDVPASDLYGRAVDFAVIQLGGFHDPTAPYDGFAGFANSFQEQVRRVRLRQTRTFKTMVRSTLMPPIVAQAVLRANPRAQRHTFGTLGISIIRSAQVFLVPLGDAGYEDGFISVGSMDLVSEEDGDVGAVCFKGEPEKVKQYSEAFRRALVDFPVSESRGRRKGLQGSSL